MARSLAATSPSSKRTALVDAAADLFARQGFRAVGIDTVLAEAGVAKMTLYKHFRSKEELIAAVLEQRGQAIRTSLAGRIAATPGGPRERLLAVFDWLETAVRSPEFHGCLFMKAASEYPTGEDLPRQAAEAFKADCHQLLEGLCRDTGASEPDALARQLQLLLEGGLVMAFLQRHPQAASDARRAAALLLEASGIHATALPPGEGSAMADADPAPVMA